MKRTKRQKLAMIVAIVLAALMILPFLIDALIPAANAAVTQKDIDKRKADQKLYQKQKAEIQSELKQLKNQKANAIKIKATLDKKIELIEMEIENSHQLIQDLNVRLAEQQDALIDNMADEKDAEELFRMRLRAMEEAGDVSYLSILFQSTSFSDLLGRMDIINEIMDADKRVIENLVDARAVIEEAKVQLEQDKADQYEISKQLAAQQAELADEYEAADEMIAELNEDAAELERAYKEAEKAEEEELDAIKKLQAELKKQQEAAKKNTQYVGGEYLFPVQGKTLADTSSPFGMRYHPILKRQQKHNGLDIRAPKGTAILAANGGTVIVASKHSSYGNYVVVDHGGGRATLYAHMSKITTSVGKTVERGEKIGEVGSTGMSTGNHLHFECIVNGERLNPEDFLPKKKK